jgi:tRNA 2-thiouridine synthesizing protein E
MTEMVMENVLESIEFNEEGFMLDSEAWTPEIAKTIAEQEGILELAEAHWKVIEFCRERATESGAAPTLRQITNGAGVTTKELFALFPKGPAKKAAKISGLGKPEGCI